MEIRKLIPSDVDALLALQTRLHDGMAHSEWLADTDRQQFDEILSGCGYGEGVFEDGKMLGAWVLYYPPKGAHCLRGQGMHSRMVKKMTAHAAADGYDYIASTVHPDNQASLRGVLGAGYRIFDTRPMYGGKMRCILYRSLKDEKENSDDTGR